MSKLFNTDLSVDSFLAEYWQQKPLLIRQAFPNLTPPLSAEELAGLACETGGNARLVLEQCGDRNWCVEYGPFDEQRFAELPDSGWSLLVSDVERVVPAALDIQQQFRFLPDWRHDDVMISYAPPGGSVGAHIDAYDVFLLQLEGVRRWQISEQFEHRVLDNTDLEILQQFEAEQEWLLEPGDMLYLPPGVAHLGVAVDACMTCSIGFRAPSTHDMAPSLLDALLEHHAEQRYRDPALKPQAHPAEITPQSLQQIRALLDSVLHYDDATLADWFGRYLSDVKSQFEQASDPLDASVTLESFLQQHPDALASHNPDCRFFFIRQGALAKLFVNGEAFTVSTAFAEALTAHSRQPLRALLEHCHGEQDRQRLLRCIHQQWLLLDT